MFINMTANFDWQKGNLNIMDENLVAGARRFERTTATQLRIGSASGQLPFVLHFFHAFTLLHFHTL